MNNKPRFIDQWVQYALDCLFLAENKRIDLAINNLCEKNTALTGEPCFGFLYQGVRYIPTKYSGLLKKQRSIPSLHFTLSKEVMAFRNDLSKLERDKTTIKQLFFILLKSCTSEQDVRNTLPECVVNLTQLKDMYPRLYDGTNQLPPEIRKEYEKVLPKIEMYSVTHLLY